MSRFYVGQRVRYISAASTSGLPYVGSEALIVAGKQEIGISPYNGRFNLCATDFMIKFANESVRLADAWQLEPLTDPGREVVSWADCVWKPHHLRSRVEA